MMTSSLLIIFFCLSSDNVCDRYSTNTASFYVDSCNGAYIEEQIQTMIKNETSFIEYDVVDYQCIKLHDR